MENSVTKIQRSSTVIKAFMALVVILQCVQYFSTQVIDMGAVAGAIGVLSLLRGLLLSPAILANPIKQWFTPQVGFSKKSTRYFILAFVLIIVSAF